MSRRTRDNKGAGKETTTGGGSDMKRFYWILGAVALIALVAVAYSVSSSPAVTGTVTGPVEVEGLDDPQTLVQLAEPVRAGDPDAPVTIMEFADYQCPACAQFARLVKPQIDLAYVESGQARLEFFDFPLSQHPNAFIAARAARCAGEQDRYWDFHDALFQNQSQWATESNPTSSFVEYAESLGMDADAFAACVRSDRFADVVTANQRLGEELRVPGTPSVMVVRGGGIPTRLQNASWDAVQEAVQEALAAGQGGS